jgi:peptide subunit release factor 1 (eRF1)
MLVLAQCGHVHDQPDHPAQGARRVPACVIGALTPIRPQDQISRVNAMLTQEYGTASNIKSRVNRLSVLAAITSTQQRLKLYNRVPPNGLVLFVGTILTDEGKEKKVSFDFEPHKPINTCARPLPPACAG